MLRGGWFHDLASAVLLSVTTMCRRAATPLDLAAPRWKMTTQGIPIEPKEDITEQLGRSSDGGDALV